MKQYTINCQTLKLWRELEKDFPYAEIKSRNKQARVCLECLETGDYLRAMVDIKDISPYFNTALTPDLIDELKTAA